MVETWHPVNQLKLHRNQRHPTLLSTLQGAMSGDDRK
jgi:hypothetical protein